MRGYVVPPKCQGQIVEVAYQQVGDILLKRVTDRSEPAGSVRYYMAYLDADEIAIVEPWNVEPHPDCDWEEIDAARAARIVDDGPFPGEA